MIVFESITIAGDKNSFAALVTCIQDLNRCIQFEVSKSTKKKKESPAISCKFFQAMSWATEIQIQF